MPDDRFEGLSRCFQGIVPSVIATVASDGTPNITYLSQVYRVDDDHVALSCQFFNKTRRNVEQNPLARVELYDPLTLQAFKLSLRYDHSETSGPVYDEMCGRIHAIASHTGMTGVFRLLAADIYQILAIERVEGFLTDAEEPMDEPTPVTGAMTELKSLQLISRRINESSDLEELLTSTLEALHQALGFDHSMVLLLDETGQKLFTVASHGYSGTGIGAEVRAGEGLIGTVAKQGRLLCFRALSSDLRYGRTVRTGIEEIGSGAELPPEIPLPGIPDAQSQMALPLIYQDRLIGVLAVESHHVAHFQDWHEAFLSVIGNQIAMGIDRMSQRDTSEEDTGPSELVVPVPPSARRRTFAFYTSDDCVFVDGEYLIRNVPARILWRILRSHQSDGRTQFSNREFRLDHTLGLPALRDNLESRLVLLRKRLEQKCPDVKLVPAGRGRFALELACGLELREVDARGGVQSAQ